MSAPYIPQVKFSSRENCPKCSTRAVVVEMFHVGNVEDTYEGKTTVKDVVHVVLELAKKKSDGSRFLIGRDIGTYLGPSQPKKGQKTVLRRMAESCFDRVDEKDFNVWSLLGKSCQVQIGETSGGNHKIESFSPLNDEQEPLKPVKPLRAWSIVDPNCKMQDADIPDFVMARAKSSREYQSQSSDNTMKQHFDATRVSGHVTDPDDDDGAPF